MTLVTQEDSDFTNIFRSSKNGFIQFAYSYLGNMQDAEDVVMESYIQYWENKDKATFQNFQYKRIHLYNYKKPMYRYSGREKILITKKRRAL